jgi:phosphate transport system permease protein
MSTTSLLVIAILILATLGYFLASKRAISTAGGDRRKLHSLPVYYGSNAAMFTAIPALGVLLIWLLAQPMLVERNILSTIPDKLIPEGSSIGLVMSDVRRVADGLEVVVSTGTLSQNETLKLDTEQTDIRALLAGVGAAVGSDVQPEVLKAAQNYRAQTKMGQSWMVLIIVPLALIGFALSVLAAKPTFRARNTVERGILALLVESINFFKLHSWTDFFFGGSWAPNFRGDSDLSILPLLWGTIYISIIALIVAVPVGLFAAIYLSEYAGPRVRAFAKPLLEILAGIPTIVYGLFALVTVGPALVRVFGRGQEGLLGLEWMSGATAVLTAGLVMGIMLIPFVSSLSDDIINAVPQSLRDGSLGLGATPSETIRQIVLPAALPGIVGAVLLAASRAIGETMIVVLGAGAIAKFSANPLDAMTTITTRIVSQLTGDTDFASPETLVAFALGLTLFVLTLGLNVIALYIVRKYREQYD